ncbi:hypothetical protein SAMN06264849_102348 [Melghirimyces algeriensis]|uniref:Uncharacterized protein n=1 Tax=Melghirimyces algeriensis TaxID=910412 RepID=A0A521BRV3_9BACL|nr:hypothetical protein SAMN06264849_102348 [Melghirimyces algeriensis]
MFFAVVIVLFPSEPEVAYVSPKWSGRLEHEDVKPRMYLQKLRNKLAHRSRIWVRQRILFFHAIKYQLKKIWVTPRRFQGDTF